MRCKTCKAKIRFVEGNWAHAVEGKCAAVVVDWPAPIVEDDAA